VQDAAPARRLLGLDQGNPGMSGRTPYMAAIWKAGVEVGRPTLIGSRRYA
jgi:hypothetical protein